MVRNLTAVYERRGDWYVAYLEEIPGVNTQGKTMEEARENLKDALDIFLEANRELARLDVSANPSATEEPSRSIRMRRPWRPRAGRIEGNTRNRRTISCLIIPI